MDGDRNPTSANLAGKQTLSAKLDCHPFFNAALDLAPNPEVGSFYIASYVESQGCKFTIVFHLMLIVGSIGRPLAQLAISVFNETTPKDYLSREMNQFWLNGTTVNIPGLDIKTPEGHLSGDIDKLVVEGRIPDKNGLQQFDMRLEMLPRGPVLPNLITGVIPFSNGVNYEFALPRMQTSGKMTVGGTEYNDITGWSWLDREWGSLGPSKWTWMNIQLDNDVQMSIWDEQNDNKNPDSYVGGPRRFATILMPTGELAVAPVAITEGDPWTSQDSQRTYPNQWQVTIPGWADLKVRSLRKGQEIVSQINAHRVEAKAEVDGIYDGKPVKGVTMVELFDLFPLFSTL